MPPKGNVPIPTDRLISNNDLKDLIIALNHSDNIRFKTIIPILLTTGLRIGELLALQWSDINFDDKTLAISKSVSINYSILSETISANGMILTTPKTVSSVRILPVSDLVIFLLKSWLLYRDERPGWKKLIIENNNENLVFPNYAGKIINSNYLYKDFMVFLKKNNLEDSKIMFHKLRHCYATHMLDAGVDIDVISKMLGHKSITTTANTYVKVSMIPKRAAVLKHEKYLNRININPQIK